MPYLSSAATAAAVTMPFVVDHYRPAIRNYTAIPYLPQYLADYTGNRTEVWVSSFWTALVIGAVDASFKISLRGVQNPVNKLWPRDVGKFPAEITLSYLNISVGTSEHKYGPGHVISHGFKPICKVASVLALTYHGMHPSDAGYYSNLCEGLAQMPISAQLDTGAKSSQSLWEYGQYVGTHFADVPRWALQGAGVILSKIAPAWIIGEGFKRLGVWKTIDEYIFVPGTYFQKLVLRTMGFGMLNLDPYGGMSGYSPVNDERIPGKWHRISESKHSLLLKAFGYLFIFVSEVGINVVNQWIATRIFLTLVRPCVQMGNDATKWFWNTVKHLLTTQAQIKHIADKMALLTADIAQISTSELKLEQDIQTIVTFLNNITMRLEAIEGKMAHTEDNTAAVLALLHNITDRFEVLEGKVAHTEEAISQTFALPSAKKEGDGSLPEFKTESAPLPQPDKSLTEDVKVAKPAATDQTNAADSAIVSQDLPSKQGEMSSVVDTTAHLMPHFDTVSADAQEQKQLPAEHQGHTESVDTTTIGDIKHDEL